MAAERAAVEHPPHQPPRAGRNHDLAGRCRGLQPRRQVWRLADRNTLSRVAGPQLLADDNQPGGDADARLKGHAGSGLQRADRVEDGKAGAHGLLGVMLMSRRVAEIDQHAIAQILGDKSVKARHHIGDRLVEGGDQIAHVLGVKACRKGHRVDHVANHDRELSPLGAAHRSRCESLCVVGARRRPPARDRWQEAAPSPTAVKVLADSLTAGDPLGGGLLRSPATSDLVSASGSVFNSRLSLILEVRIWWSVSSANYVFSDLSSCAMQDERGHSDEDNLAQIWRSAQGGRTGDIYFWFTHFFERRRQLKSSIPGLNFPSVARLHWPGNSQTRSARCGGRSIESNGAQTETSSEWAAQVARQAGEEPKSPRHSAC